MTEPDIYLIPFSHLDLFWLGRREECLSRGSRIIASALDIARDHPDFRFLLEDMVFVAYFLDVHPERAGELREQVGAGRIELGAKWAGVYQHWQPEESMARNVLYGKQFARERLGSDPDAIHMGDLPGHVPQFAQLLKRAGVKGLVVCRGGPDNEVLFRWRAPDGSSVLTWSALRGYPWAWWVGFHSSVDEALSGRTERGRTHLPLDEDARRIMDLTPAPILMHWGIDLAVPPEDLVHNVEAWNDRLDLPMTFATLSEYFDAVADVEGIPDLTGEIVSVWPGMEASAAGFFYLTAPANYALTEAENWCELARRLGLGDYNADTIAAGWKLLLQGMDHNWGGTGGTDSNLRHREYLMRALLLGQDLRRWATHKIAENIRLPEGDDITPIVVFNSASWPRTDVVTAHASFYGDVTAFSRPDTDDGDPFEFVHLYDADGEEVDFQYLDKAAPITREATICFTAQDVPPFGYRLYYLKPGRENEPSDPCCQVSGLEEDTTVTLESSRLRLEVERPTGRVNLFDKEMDAAVATGMELVGYEDGRDASIFDPTPSGRSFPNAIDGIELTENGPVRARLLIRGRIGRNETLQEWILTRDTSEVEVIDHITWAGHPSPIFIQRVMPTGIDKPTVTYGLPFGANTWENRMPKTGPRLRDELPKETVDHSREPLHWIDVSDDEGGVAIATERHGVQRDGATIRIALLHAGGGRGPLLISWGDHHFTTRTRLRAHAGTWQDARSYRDGMALYLPLFAISGADPLSPKRLDPVAGLCDPGADNVILTTVKKAESGEGTVLRGYEVEGREIATTPRLVDGEGSWYEVDLMEEDLRAVENAVVWRPFEIKTLLVKPDES